MEANMENYYAYNGSLQPYANRLRKEMTKAEACLWKYALRASKRKGYGFRRQRPVLNFIADFMCKELKLIIEVDGISHSWNETVQKDRVKVEMLRNAGFEIIRFTDEDVLKNINGVTEVIDFKIDEIEKVLGLPPPNPLHEGENTCSECLCIIKICVGTNVPRWRG